MFANRPESHAKHAHEPRPRTPGGSTGKASTNPACPPRRPARTAVVQPPDHQLVDGRRQRYEALHRSRRAAALGRSVGPIAAHLITGTGEGELFTFGTLATRRLPRIAPRRTDVVCGALPWADRPGRSRWHRPVRLSPPRNTSDASTWAGANTLTYINRLRRKLHRDACRGVGTRAAPRPALVLEPDLVTGVLGSMPHRIGDGIGLGGRELGVGQRVGDGVRPPSRQARGGRSVRSPAPNQ